MKTLTKSIYQYYKKELRLGNQPKLKDVGDLFGVSITIIREHLRGLCDSGKLIRRSHKFYLATGDIFIDQRKNTTNDSTNQKKAQAGRAGAQYLKELAFARGAQRNAFTSIGKDDLAIAKRIETIARAAEGKGTCYRPNTVSGRGLKRG